jgi:hypothetical protein
MWVDLVPLRYVILMGFSFPRDSRRFWCNGTWLYIQLFEIILRTTTSSFLTLRVWKRESPPDGILEYRSLLVVVSSKSYILTGTVVRHTSRFGFRCKITSHASYRWSWRNSVRMSFYLLVKMLLMAG